jgi:hypothetical protein
MARNFENRSRNAFIPKLQDEGVFGLILEVANCDFKF